MRLAWRYLQKKRLQVSMRCTYNLSSLKCTLLEIIFKTIVTDSIHLFRIRMVKWFANNLHSFQNYLVCLSSSIFSNSRFYRLKPYIYSSLYFFLQLDLCFKNVLISRLSVRLDMTALFRFVNNLWHGWKVNILYGFASFFQCSVLFFQLSNGKCFSRFTLSFVLKDMNPYKTCRILIMNWSISC